MSVDSAVSARSETLPAMPGVACEDPLDGADELGDLGYYDGPLTTLFRRGDDLLIASWAGRGDDAHRWMVVVVSRERLRALGDGAVAFRDLLTQPEGGHLWLTDRDGAAVFRSSRIVPADLDPRYLPDPGVTFSREEWHDREIIAEAGL